MTIVGMAMRILSAAEELAREQGADMMDREVQEKVVKEAMPELNGQNRRSAHVESPTDTWGVEFHCEYVSEDSASCIQEGPGALFRDRKGTPKNFSDKDFTELSGELSGAICLKTLVLMGSDRQPPRIVQKIIWRCSCDFLALGFFWLLNFDIMSEKKTPVRVANLVAFQWCLGGSPKLFQSLRMARSWAPLWLDTLQQCGPKGPGLVSPCASLPRCLLGIQSTGVPQGWMMLAD